MNVLCNFSKKMMLHGHAIQCLHLGTFYNDLDHCFMQAGESSIHGCEWSVATLALGSWPKQRLARLQAKREAQKSHLIFLGVQKSVKEWTFALPNEFQFGSWSPNGLPNLQREIARVKTHWIKWLFISLKSS